MYDSTLHFDHEKRGSLTINRHCGVRLLTIEEKYAPIEYEALRTNGTVNVKKFVQPDDRTPFAQSAPEKCDQTLSFQRTLWFPRDDRATVNLNPNQRAGRAQVHLVASVFQVRHIKKPTIAGLTRSRLQNFQRTPAIECGWNIPLISVSRAAVAKIAMQMLRIRSPPNLIARIKRDLESEVPWRSGFRSRSTGIASRLRRRSSSASTDLASSRREAISAERTNNSSSVFEE